MEQGSGVPPAHARRDPGDGGDPGPLHRSTVPAGRGLEALLAGLDRRLALEAGAPAVEPPPGYLADAKGRLVPEHLIEPADVEEDAAVRRIAAFALDLQDQIARFKAHSHGDVAAFLDLTSERYGSARRPGRKGNLSLRSLDGRLRITIHVQERIAWGPELQAARELIDACIAEWSAGSRPEAAALLQSAFEVDVEGRVSREAVFRLRRLDFDDDRWRRAKAALADAVRVVGSRTYLRVHYRGSADGEWRAIPIALAAAWQETGRLEAEEAADAGGGAAAGRTGDG